MTLPSYNTLANLSDAEFRGFVALVQMVQKTRNAVKMNTFDYGDRVTFIGRGIRYSGVVQKFNRKTVTVRTDGGMIWRVSPALLSPAKATEKVA